MEEEKLRIYVILKGKDVETFKKIKKELNLNSNAEVIRYVIDKGYKKLFSEFEKDKK